MKKNIIIKKHEEFNDIIKNGKKIISKYFIINYIENNYVNSRFGISVGTKLGNAVLRNKYKRKMRSIIDENSLIHDLKKDFIIIFRKNGLNVEYINLKKDFDKLIENKFQRSHHEK